jgi:hypothetical protein
MHRLFTLEISKTGEYDAKFRQNLIFREFRNKNAISAKAFEIREIAKICRRS